MLARYVSVSLFRFPEPITLADDERASSPGTALFRGIGQDHHVGGYDRTSASGVVWGAVALHAEESAARKSLSSDAALFAADPAERWSLLLEPFRHNGEVNWLVPAEPGRVFDTGVPPAPDEPFVTMTTVGFDIGPGFDPARAVSFSERVDAVYAAMDGAEGVRHRHTLRFGGGWDPSTFTLWSDGASMQAFAYRGGEHRRHMDDHRAHHLADRTSFTRHRIIDSEGSWMGMTPV